MDVGIIPFYVLFLLYTRRIPLRFWIESTEHKLNVAFPPRTWQQVECRLTLIVLQPEQETWGPGRVPHGGLSEQDWRGGWPLLRRLEVQAGILVIT